MEGYIDDISLGVFFALELYRYAFAGLLMYAEHPLFRPTRFSVLIPRFCQYELKGLYIVSAQQLPLMFLSKSGNLRLRRIL